MASTDVPGFLFLDPRFSPDGKWLTVKRVEAHVDGVQLALIAAEGSGKPISLGPRQTTNAAEIYSAFSPFGTAAFIPSRRMCWANDDTHHLAVRDERPREVSQW